MPIDKKTQKMFDSVTDNIIKDGQKQTQNISTAGGFAHKYEEPLKDEHPGLNLALMYAQPGNILAKLMAPSMAKGTVYGLMNGEGMMAVGPSLKNAAFAGIENLEKGNIGRSGERYNAGKRLLDTERESGRVSKSVKATTSGPSEKVQKFMQLSQQEQNNIVKYWNGENFSSLWQLQRAPKEYRKFLKWIETHKQGGILKGQNSIKVPESATSKAYFSGLKDYLLHQTKSFMPSQYKPTKGSNIQQQYYTRPGLKEEVVLNLFGGTDSNAKGPVGQNYFYKDFDDAYNKLSLANESRIASNGTLGNYGVSAGVDDKGRYISFIDIFDHVFIPGKGIPIYDRIYEDEIKSLYNPNRSALNEGDWITRSPILKRISKYKLNKGGIIKAQDGTFEGFWNTLPQNQQDSTDFNVRRYWELNGKPVNFKEAIKRGMYKKEKDGYHANSIAFNEETGEYEFMKSPNHPTIQYELDWFNSDKANKFRNKYQLDSTSIPWKYVPKGQAGMVLGSALLSRSDTIKNISDNIRKWGTNLKNHINTINRYNPEQVPVIGQPGVTTVRRAKIGPLVSARGKDPKIVENGGEI